MIAPKGTPVVAVADGRVSQKVNGTISGLGIEITDTRGYQYFYAHLSAFGRGLHAGQRVRVGDVLGYVGNTGDAQGGVPHLHFEVQPGGTSVPPKPYVDGWLRLAEDRARRLVKRRTHRPVRHRVEPWGLQRHLDTAEPVWLTGDARKRTTPPTAETSSGLTAAASSAGGLAVMAAGYSMWMVVRRRRDPSRSGPPGLSPHPQEPDVRSYGSRHVRHHLEPSAASTDVPPPHFRSELHCRRLPMHGTAGFRRVEY
jgi:hypothetical protein